MLYWLAPLLVILSNLLRSFDFTVSKFTNYSTYGINKSTNTTFHSRCDPEHQFKVIQGRDRKREENLTWVAWRVYYFQSERDIGQLLVAFMRNFSARTFLNNT